MSNPYSGHQPSAQAMPDVRPLRKRKRVWVGALTLLVVGGCMGSGGSGDSAGASPAPTATKTVTATPEPEPTVTVTETVTESPEPEPEPEETTEDRGSVSSGEDDDGGSGSATTTGGGGGGSVYYSNCSEARAAGAAPIHRGEPGYARHLDRDGDGIGCDS